MASLIIQGDPGAIWTLQGELLDRHYIGHGTDFEQAVVESDLIDVMRGATNDQRHYDLWRCEDSDDRR